MPQGDKSSYNSKQKRMAEHIEESYEKRYGTNPGRAKAIAWATVNKQTGGAAKKGHGNATAYESSNSSKRSSSSNKSHSNSTSSSSRTKRRRSDDENEEGYGRSPAMNSRSLKRQRGSQGGRKSGRSEGQHLKSDGSPDMRYKSSRSISNKQY